MPDHPRIIFMGTPDFAVPSLQAILDAGFPVPAVITAPDRPAGRGLQMKASPVKAFAESKGIPVLQPEKLRDPEFLHTLLSYHADLQVVVAFRMLPEVVWSMPPLGTLNLHASLLPDYRGAAPINHAILQGETETGVTTFFLQHAIDTGDIILQEKVAITPDDTAGTLHDKLMQTGAQLVRKTVEAIATGAVQPVPQWGNSSKTAPKIFREDCEINWDQPVENIRNFVRGLSPYPTAWTTFQDKTLKVFSCSAEPSGSTKAAGSFETYGETYLRVAGADGWVYLTDIQPEGKKRMDIQAYLRGYRG